MSAANVKFFTEDHQPAAPGTEARFLFSCPRGNNCGGLLIAGRTKIPRDPQGKNGGRPQWDWNGNRDLPTFAPSINCEDCWHGYIENGRCVSTSKVDEPEPRPGARR